MEITEKEVIQVASLAKLAVPEEERQAVTEQFDKIIHMVAQLNEVETTGVTPLVHVNQVVNVLREDVAIKGTDRELLMKNVPDTDGIFIKVPAIMDNGEGNA